MPQLQAERSADGRFDLGKLDRARIAVQCVCCGSFDLRRSPAILMPFVADRTFGWQPVMIDESWGLRTIQNGMAYTICSSLCCNDCGLLFLDMRFSERELDRLYMDYRGTEYNALRDRYEPGYQNKAGCFDAVIPYIGQVEAFLEPYLSFPVNILDWGGDTGINTPFRHRGKAVDIYDISRKPVVRGARMVSRDALAGSQYDLVVCSNVLEHVPYPADILRDIVNIMDMESVLYVEVPFEDVVRLTSGDVCAAKRHWHEHVNFFSESSIVALLSNCGLRILELTRLCPVPVVPRADPDSGYLFQIACKLATGPAVVEKR